MDTLARVASPLATPSELDRGEVRAVAAALNTILTDPFALYLTTKHFH